MRKVRQPNVTALLFLFVLYLHTGDRSAAGKFTGEKQLDAILPSAVDG